jgi:hypothetical protein
VSYLPQADEQALLAAGLPAFFINELLAMQAGDTRFESRLATAHNFTSEPRYCKNHTHEGGDLSAGLETRTHIPKVPHGPWRSLGGCFDYSQWEDRDRFLELDKALASAPQCSEPEEEVPTEISKWIEDERLRTWCSHLTKPEQPGSITENASASS